MLSLAALAIVVAQATDFLDHAIANVLTWFLSIVAAVVLLVWFSLSSGYPKRARMATLAGCLAAVAGFIGLFRVEHLSGELVPTFAPAFFPQAGPLAAPPERDAAEKTRCGDRQATDLDFPQFLGPDRSVVGRARPAGPGLGGQAPRLCWRHEIGAGWSAFSVVHGHAVTMEQRGDQEMVTCYRVRDGPSCEWSVCDRRPIRCGRVRASGPAARRPSTTAASTPWGAAGVWPASTGPPAAPVGEEPAERVPA